MLVEYDYVCESCFLQQTKTPMMAMIMMMPPQTEKRAISPLSISVPSSSFVSKKEPVYWMSVVGSGVTGVPPPPELGSTTEHAGS